MSKDEKANRSKLKSGALDKFRAGRRVGPLDDRNEYQQRLNSLPAEQKEFAEESTRFADLCQYFSHTRAMKDINRELMEYLDDVGQDPGIRE